MRVEKFDQPGLIVVFTYDDLISDAYEVYGDEEVGAVLGWIGSGTDPVRLLIDLRRIMKITVH